MISEHLRLLSLAGFFYIKICSIFFNFQKIKINYKLATKLESLC